MNKILKILTINLGLVLLAASGFAGSHQTVPPVQIPTPDATVSTLQLIPKDKTAFINDCLTPINETSTTIGAVTNPDGSTDTFACTRAGSGPGVVNEQWTPWLVEGDKVTLNPPDPPLLGIGTITPTSKLHIVGNGLIVDQDPSAAPLDIEADTIAMGYDSNKGAFRAGGSGPRNAWDKSRVGVNSTAGGLDNIAYGVNSAAFGQSNTITRTGKDGFTAGNNNFIDGPNSIALGKDNIIGSAGGATGKSSIAIGHAIDMRNVLEYAYGLGKGLVFGLPKRNVVGIGVRDDAFIVAQEDNTITLANQVLISSKGIDGGSNPANLSLMVDKGIQVGLTGGAVPPRFVPSDDKLVRQTSGVVTLTGFGPPSPVPLDDTVVGYVVNAIGDHTMYLPEPPDFCGEASYQPVFIATAKSANAFTVFITILSATASQIHFTTSNQLGPINPLEIHFHIICKAALSGEEGS